MRAVEDADDPSERYTPEDLHDELLDGSWKDPDRDSILGLDDEGTARAFGHVELPPGDRRTIRAFCWGGVDPQWRGRGIGRELLAWQERLARARIAAAPHPAPGRILVHVGDHVTPTVRLLERAGFARMRVYLELTRPLDGSLPPVGVQDGLRLVPYDPSLSEQVRLAHNEAFAEHWNSESRSPEDWERRSVGGRYFRPEWSFVVLDGEEVAGYCLTSAYEPDWHAQGYTAGWTDVLGVRHAWRRRGGGLGPAHRHDAPAAGRRHRPRRPRRRPGEHQPRPRPLHRARVRGGAPRARLRQGRVSRGGQPGSHDNGLDPHAT